MDYMVLQELVSGTALERMVVEQTEHMVLQELVIGTAVEQKAADHYR